MSDEQEVVDQVHSEETQTIQEQEKPEDQIASKKDVQAVLDAVIELTKIVGELAKENTKWFRAGKMGGV